jgi:hypothetical protein
MPAVVLADGDENARGFAGFEDHDNLIGMRTPKVGIDERISPLPIRRLNDGHVPLGRAGGYPVLVLRSDRAKDGFAHRVEVPIGVEEAHNALGLLKGLDEPIEQDSIETPVRETDAIVMMLVEGVHEVPPGRGTTGKHKSMTASTSVRVLREARL